MIEYREILYKKNTLFYTFMIIEKSENCIKKLKVLQ